MWVGTKVRLGNRNSQFLLPKCHFQGSEIPESFISTFWPSPSVPLDVLVTWHQVWVTCSFLSSLKYLVEPILVSSSRKDLWFAYLWPNLHIMCKSFITLNNWVESIPIFITLRVYKAHILPELKDSSGFPCDLKLKGSLYQPFCSKGWGTCLLFKECANLADWNSLQSWQSF